LKDVPRKVVQLGSEEFSAFSRVEHFSSLKKDDWFVCVCVQLVRTG